MFPSWLIGEAVRNGTLVPVLRELSGVQQSRAAADCRAVAG
jgi:hypothetical protein